MGQSQKKMSRGRLKRLRQLKKQRERADSSEDEFYVQEEAFDFQKFLKKRKIELGFVVILIVGILGVMSLAPDQRAIKETRRSIDSLLLENVWEWDQKYPNGYKVVAFSDDRIVYTSFDTLPKELKVNWKDISVTRIQTDQMTESIEKINIEMEHVNYAPADISGLTISTTLLRQMGAVGKLTQLDQLIFTAKIVKDTGDQVFCLFGLESR